MFMQWIIDNRTVLYVFYAFVCLKKKSCFILPPFFTVLPLEGFYDLVGRVNPLSECNDFLGNLT